MLKNCHWRGPAHFSGKGQRGAASSCCGGSYMSNDNEITSRVERFDGWTEERRNRFLERLSETANVAMAARSVRKSVSGAYQLRRRDAEFAEAWEAALTTAMDELEALVLDRVVNGVEKPVFYAGKQCGSVRQYSDSLAMFMLRARRPDVYGRVAAVAEEPESNAAEEARTEMQNRLKTLGDRLKAA